MSELKYVLREWFVVACISLRQVVYGIALALPAIIAPTLTQDGADIRATDDQVSWFLTSCGLMIPISYIILPAIMQIFGRRWCYVLGNCCFFVGFIIIATASDVTNLIIGRAILGMGYAGGFITCIMIAEYTHPRKRSFYTVFAMFVTYSGLLVGHFFGSKAAWRELAWLSTIITTVCVIITYKLPESPAWLAYKGHYDDCTRCFKYIRGQDTESIKELNELITAQRELATANSESDYGTSFIATARSFQSKELLRIIVKTVVLLTLYESSGCNYIIVNLVQIMTKMTVDHAAAYYFTMAFDIVRILSVAVSSVIVKTCKRKTVLIWSASIAYSNLCLVCVLYYCSKVMGNSLMKWLAPVFLLLYEAVCSSGLFSVIIIVAGEIFPLKFRGIGIAVVGLILGAGDASTSKLTPLMLESFDIHGTFGIYLLISVVLLPVLYFLLPETQNKSLQEIENNMIKFKISKPISNKEEMNLLVALPLEKIE